MTGTKKRDQIKLRIESAVKWKVKELADINYWSMNTWINIAIKEKLKRDSNAAE